MSIKAGTTDSHEWSGSMAQAIETAFRREWPSVMKGTDLPPSTSPDLKLLFAAIAQGVVGYLKKHAADLTVDGTADSYSHEFSTNVNIKTSGTKENYTMSIKAGTTDSHEWSGSMAQAIETAFRREWPSVMKGTDLPPSTSPDLKLLFAAIAQGVVGYLKKHAADLTVDGTADSYSHEFSTNVNIKTSGTLHVS